MLKLLLPSFVACRRLLNNRDEEETDAEHGPQSKKEDMIFYSYVCIYIERLKVTMMRGEKITLKVDPPRLV